MYLPPLILDDWKDTRDTLHKYCGMIGLIREKLSDPLPRWQHISLSICERGITSSAILKNKFSTDQSFEVILDLNQRQLLIESSFRETKYISLTGQSLNALCDETCSMLQDIGIHPPIDKPNFMDGKRGCFNPEGLSNYFIVIKNINSVLCKVKEKIGGNTSPVQLWPYHFDLVLSWYSGKLLQPSGSDTEIDEEQITFGFSTGDDSISEPYFYVTLYPVPQDLPGKSLPKNFFWNTAGFIGAVLNYKDIIYLPDPADFLYNSCLEMFELFQHHIKP